MQINTKRFGEIEVNEEKIITFENGIIGFPQLQHFMLILFLMSIFELTLVW